MNCPCLMSYILYTYIKPLNIMYMNIVSNPINFIIYIFIIK